MERTCRNCGTINDDGGNICNKCGYPLEVGNYQEIKPKKLDLITHKKVENPICIFLLYIIFFIMAVTIYKGLFHYIPKLYETYIGSISDITNKIAELVNRGTIPQTIKDIVYYIIVNGIPLLIGYYIVVIISRYFTFKKHTVEYSKIRVLVFDIFLVYLLYGIINALFALYTSANILEAFLTSFIPLFIFLPLIRKNLVRDYIIE